MTLEMASNLLERIVGEGGQGTDKRRTAFLVRALWGEFACTTIFFLVVFAAIANTNELKYEAFEANLVVSLSTTFGAIAVIFCYSDVSGANFNMAISFSLWLTGKLSNRKLILYWLTQLLGALLALGLLALVYTPSSAFWNAYAVQAGDDLSAEENWRVFAKEFIATFVLTYVVFHIAFEDAEAEKRSSASSRAKTAPGGITVYTTAPNSKGAFTPFVFGFLLFGLLNVNGAAMNPLRIVAPAIVCSMASSGSNWSSAWVFVLGELLGAAAAGGVVHFIERLHKRGQGDEDDEEDEIIKTPLIQ